MNIELLDKTEDLISHYVKTGQNHLITKELVKVFELGMLYMADEMKHSLKENKVKKHAN